MRKYKFKKVTNKDYLTIFNWRNERQARKYSYNKKKFNLQLHQQWLKYQLRKKYDHFWFFVHRKTKIGFIRLNLKSKKFILSYLISKKFRKKKLATKMLKQMINTIKKKKQNRKLFIIANVNTSNIASRQSLLASGFKLLKKSKKFLTFKYSFYEN